MVWWWILGGIGALLVASIALSAINDWFSANTDELSDYGEIVRTKVREGEYRVVAGVFNHKQNRTAQCEWEGDIDEELKAAFGTKNSIRVQL
jgi:hypothetical protein